MATHRVVGAASYGRGSSQVPAACAPFLRPYATCPHGRLLLSRPGSVGTKQSKRPFGLSLNASRRVAAIAAVGTGVVAHAGSVAVRLLADRRGLTGELSKALLAPNTTQAGPDAASAHPPTLRLLGRDTTLSRKPPGQIRRCHQWTAHVRQQSLNLAPHNGGWRLWRWSIVEGKKVAQTPTLDIVNQELLSNLTDSTVIHEHLDRIGGAIEPTTTSRALSPLSTKVTLTCFFMSSGGRI